MLVSAPESFGFDNQNHLVPHRVRPLHTALHLDAWGELIERHRLTQPAINLQPR
jgi:hypothetical protein